MARKNQIVEEYAHTWPREVFDCLVPGENSRKKLKLVRGLELLDRPRVYVLYRDDVPYYVGQAIRLAWADESTCLYTGGEVPQFLEFLFGICDSRCETERRD